MHAARTCICDAMRQTPNSDPFKDVTVVKEKKGSVEVLVSSHEAETGMENVLSSRVIAEP
jgi:hypothetical protein